MKYKGADKMSEHQPYATEIEDVIKLEILDEPTVLALYDDLADTFRSVAMTPHPHEAQARTLELRNRKQYHAKIDEVEKEYDERLSWHSVRFRPKRIKRCIICQSWYYDRSRFNKNPACDKDGIYFEHGRYRHDKYGNKLSVCEVEYDKRRRAAPTGEWTEEDIIYPYSGRKVNEVLVDLQPSANDRRGHAILNEMNEAWNDYY